MKGSYKVERSEVDDFVARDVRTALLKLPLRCYDEQGNISTYNFNVSALSERQGNLQDWKISPHRKIGSYELVPHRYPSFEFIESSETALTVKIRGHRLKHELHLFYQAEN